MLLLSEDFVRLIVISFVIAAPMAWYVMHRWLEDFAYRVELNAWIFVIAGLLAVGVALVTVTVQALRAARANPVRSLRSE